MPWTKRLDLTWLRGVKVSEEELGPDPGISEEWETKAMPSKTILSGSLNHEKDQASKESVYIS